MAWLRKKPDPISSRARELNNEIAALEAQIKKLDQRLQQQQQKETREPRDREHSTSLQAPAHYPGNPPPRSKPVEPIFEPVDLNRLQQPGDAEGQNSDEHYNELGMRKYDLPALLRRVKGQFQGPSTTNPKLVSYLAAGGIQGLRPLRYEKRVARNRFIVLALFLFVMLVGFLLVFVRR